MAGTTGTTITFMPRAGVLIAGSHETMPGNPNILASGGLEKTVNEKTFAANYKTKTNIISPQLRRLAASIATNKMQIMIGKLTAADFEANRENLEHLILVRLHQQLMGEQYRWFHLDEMFNTINLDKLLYRMSFRDNPAAAQEVGPREEYDTTRVTYDEVTFNLTKKVTSYDIPIEDPLRAFIDPVLPLEDNNEYSLAFLREQSALAALKLLKYHYKKDASGSARFTGSTAPANNATQRVSDPGSIEDGNVHSDNKTVNEIQDMRNAFTKEFDLILTHFACSPKTAMAVAQNTWTENNTIFNVEAYRTNGGVRTFPGLADATMVISLMVPDNVLYAASKPNNVLVKAEGPKIMKSWEDHNRWTTQKAKADFFQYKCAHEDLDNITRKFGVIVDLQTA